jgi:drug/metabolite transporter (DMT)-like permease
MRRPSAAEVMLLVTVLIWAFGFTVTKYLLENGFKPLAFSSLRFAAAGMLFTLITYGRERSFSLQRRHLLLLLGASFVGIYLNQIAFVYAIDLTTASTVALIFGTLPIVTALFAYGFGVERLSRRFWVAAGFSFAGVALVAAGGEGGLSSNLTGNALAFVGAATWGLYSVAIVPLMRNYSPYRISAIALGAGAVPLIATGLPQLLEQDWDLSALVWAGFVFAVLGPLVLTNVLWFTAIDRVGPSRATLVTNLQPFLAAVFAVVLLSETITVVQFAGGAAIGLGLLLARRRTPAAEPT